jgi:hypothetical protein
MNRQAGFPTPLFVASNRRGTLVVVLFFLLVGTITSMNVRGGDIMPIQRSPLLQLLQPRNPDVQFGFFFYVLSQCSLQAILLFLVVLAPIVPSYKILGLFMDIPNPCQNISNIVDSSFGNFQLCSGMVQVDFAGFRNLKARVVYDAQYESRTFHRHEE